jgi:hypothetical protein
MQRFRSAGSAQRFLSAHASVYNTFNISTSVAISSRLQQSVGSALRPSRHGAPLWALLTEAAFPSIGSTEPDNVTNPAPVTAKIEEIP